MRKVSLGPNQPTFKAMCVKFGTVSLNRKQKNKGRNESVSTYFIIKTCFDKADVLSQIMRFDF